MTVKNKTNKNYKRSQKGRSMVEMLGVLAIVGVLSVGGLYGYGVAMKKHKANELLHQASMLATTISAQAMTNDGNLPQTITSFGNSSYGNFSTSVTDALDGKGFSITIENVDSGACTQLEKMAGGMVRDVDCDEATGDAIITYYKNLATTEAEGEKSPTGGTTEPTDPACEGVECPEGTSCGVAGNCVAPAASNGCSKNSDCNTWCESNKGADDYGCYCQISANDYNWNSDWTDCSYNDFVGTCQTITKEEYRQGFSDKRVFTWWSTKNFCAAINRVMATAQTFCYDYSGGSSCLDMGDDFYWLQECWHWCDIDDGTPDCAVCNDNSCFAYNVNSGGHLDGATYDRSDTAIAVCE